MGSGGEGRDAGAIGQGISNVQTWCTLEAALTQPRLGVLLTAPSNFKPMGISAKGSSGHARLFFRFWTSQIQQPPTPDPPCPPHVPASNIAHNACLAGHFSATITAAGGPVAMSIRACLGCDIWIRVCAPMSAHSRSAFYRVPGQPPRDSHYVWNWPRLLPRLSHTPLIKHVHRQSSSITRHPGSSRPQPSVPPLPIKQHLHTPRGIFLDVRAIGTITTQAQLTFRR